MVARATLKKRNPKNKKIRVVFKKLAPYQKKDCLYCEDKAKLQADAHGKRGLASFRCCRKKKCMAAAKKNAGEMFS